MRGTGKEKKEVNKMMFRKAISLFTAGVMMAGMFAATGSMGAMAAEKITEAKAKEIALEDAGLSESDLIYDRIEMGHEQGASVYEIDLRTSTTEYDYDIAVADGEIVNESWELSRPSASGSQISEAEAKEKAVKDAGVSQKDVTFTKVGIGTEDGIPVYELEFENADEEFDYDVAKEGGKILNASRKVKVPASVAAAEKSKANIKTGKTGRDAAIDAALSHAGFSANDVHSLKCNKDYDDGLEIYEVEFKKGGYEYSYDIDAYDYSVLEWDRDYDD